MESRRVAAPKILKFALRKLEDMQYSEAAALSGATALSRVPSEQRSLIKILGQIHCVLMNAQANWEDTQNTDPNVKNCLDELIDAGSKTEIAVLMFLDNGRSIKPGTLHENFKKIKPVNFFALHKFKADLQCIKSLVKMINIEDLGVPNDRAITQPARQSLCNGDNIWLPDLEINHKSIVQRLVDQSLQTHSVVLEGTKLFAKTVLAEKIYQSTEVKTHFESCFWLFPPITDGTRCYSGLVYHRACLFKLTDILRKMLLKLGDTKLLDADDEDYLVSRLHQSLRGKRCLFVGVDNSWKVLWTLVNAAFPDGNNGSRLLITTEDQGQTSDQEEEDKAVQTSDEEEEDEAVQTSDEEEDEAGQTSDEEEEDEVLLTPMLNKSYSELPSVLKTCIVYTAAVFPCGSIILADTLIRLWIVEGIIPNEEETTMEKQAESYLEQLVQRGLLHIFQAYYHNQANHPIRTIMLHPRLHLIINKTARKAMQYGYDEMSEILPVVVVCSVDEFDGYDDKERFYGFALHMQYQFNQISSFREGPNLQRFHHRSLHSLFFFHYVAAVPSPPFTFLRVLAVFSSHIRFPEEYAPCWLDELINLRYLGFIVCFVEGGSLGKTIDHLGNLEILDLSESFVLGISEFIKYNKKVKIVGPVKSELPEIWSPLPDMFQ